jgi:hypothetical protein
MVPRRCERSAARCGNVRGYGCRERWRADDHDCGPMRPPTDGPAQPGRLTLRDAIFAAPPSPPSARREIGESIMATGSGGGSDGSAAYLIEGLPLEPHVPVGPRLSVRLRAQRRTCRPLPPGRGQIWPRLGASAFRWSSAGSGPAARRIFGGTARPSAATSRPALDRAAEHAGRRSRVAAHRLDTIVRRTAPPLPPSDARRSTGDGRADVRMTPLSGAGSRSDHVANLVRSGARPATMISKPRAACSAAVGAGPTPTFPKFQSAARTRNKIIPGFPRNPVHLAMSAASATIRRTGLVG